MAPVQGGAAPAHPGLSGDALMDAMLQGVANAFSLTNLTFCFLGVFLGPAMGVLPGIGALAAVSLLLPITYHLDPTTAIILLPGVYYGAESGGPPAPTLYTDR